jgi:hypothetical protein
MIFLLRVQIPNAKKNAAFFLSVSSDRKCMFYMKNAFGVSIDLSIGDETDQIVDHL